MNSTQGRFALKSLAEMLGVCRFNPAERAGKLARPRRQKEEALLPAICRVVNARSTYG